MLLKISLFETERGHTLGPGKKWDPGGVPCGPSGEPKKGPQGFPGVPWGTLGYPGVPWGPQGSPGLPGGPQGSPGEPPKGTPRGPRGEGRPPGDTPRAYAFSHSKYPPEKAKFCAFFRGFRFLLKTLGPGPSVCPLSVSKRLILRSNSRPPGHRIMAASGGPLKRGRPAVAPQDKSFRD